MFGPTCSARPGGGDEPELHSVITQPEGSRTKKKYFVLFLSMYMFYQVLIPGVGCREERVPTHDFGWREGSQGELSGWTRLNMLEA